MTARVRRPVGVRAYLLASAALAAGVYAAHTAALSYGWLGGDAELVALALCSLWASLAGYEGWRPRAGVAGAALPLLALLARGEYVLLRAGCFDAAGASEACATPGAGLARYRAVAVALALFAAVGLVGALTGRALRYARASDRSVELPR